MPLHSETQPAPDVRGGSPIFIISLALLASCGPSSEVLDESRQATGVQVGEVTETSAIVAMRLTEKAQRRNDGILRRKRSVKKVPPEIPNIPDLEGSAPGAPGRVRVRYSPQQGAFDNFPEGPADGQETPWNEVKAGDDFTHQFVLTGLQPATVYYFSAETSNLDGSVLHQPLLGQFETAPPADEYADVTFTVITGQMYMHSDHKDGFMAYDSMAALKPKFIVPTGDTVYYDSDDPPAATIDLARYHWHRMYSFPKLIDFHLKVLTYFEKDDPRLAPQRWLARVDARFHGRVYLRGGAEGLQRAGAHEREALPYLPLGPGLAGLGRRGARLPLAQHDGRRPGEDDLGR